MDSDTREGTRMARWLRRAAAISVGWVGIASAQQPLTPAGLANTGPVPRTAAAVPAPAPALDEPVTLVIRTTGQPERRLKVLKRSAYENGETLVDVQDTMSGERFTLPGAVADRMPRLNGGAVAPSPAPPPAQLAPVPPPQPTYQQVPPPQPTYLPAPPPVARPLQQPPTTVPAAPKPTDDIWKPVLQDTGPAPQPAPAPARVIPSPAFTPVPVSPGPATPAPVPAPPTAPAGDRWKPIPPPSPTPVPVSFRDDGLIVRGQLPLTDRPPERPVVRAGWTTGAAAVRGPEVAGVERTANWTATVPVIAVERPNREAWLEEIVRREMQPLANELRTAVRPSVRVSAAIGLAEMRYAARPEVKDALAKAAMTDPADLVRTVCVRALARLGYDGREYVEFLETTAWGTASGDALRVAATDALRQLRPRN